MSNIITFDEFKTQADSLLASGFLPPTIKNKNQLMAIAMKGNEVGLPPMQAISQIHIVSGRPCMSAEAMLGLVFKNIPSAEIVYKELSNEKCVISARRVSTSDYSTFSFDIADARQAGLLSKQVWKQYPRAMLKARCISEMCRSLFPDAIAGISYTPEEITQDDNLESLRPAVRVDDTKVVESIKSTKKNEPKQDMNDSSALSSEIPPPDFYNEDELIDRPAALDPEINKELPNMAQTITAFEYKKLVDYCTTKKIPNTYVKKMLEVEFRGKEAKKLTKIEYLKLLNLLGYETT